MTPKLSSPENAIEWIARSTAPLHAALKKYPDAFEALHFLFNEMNHLSIPAQCAAVAWMETWPDGEVSYSKFNPGEKAEALGLTVTPLYALTSTQAPAQCAWRPIETAPKDRSRILLWQANGGAFEGWWHDGWPSLESYWMDDADSEPEPTHWRPLLPAPSGDTNENKPPPRF